MLPQVCATFPTGWCVPHMHGVIDNSGQASSKQTGYLAFTIIQYLSAAMPQQLWFLFNPRINLSPFTKDFRGEEQQMSL